MDSLLLEAMREVDAMLPDSPPIAPPPPVPPFPCVSEARQEYLFHGRVVTLEWLKSVGWRP